MQITHQVSEFLTVFLISSESRRYIHERWNVSKKNTCNSLSVLHPSTKSIIFIPKSENTLRAHETIFQLKLWKFFYWRVIFSKKMQVLLTNDYVEKWISLKFCTVKEGFISWIFAIETYLQKCSPGPVQGLI
jgi:hypothetical protein